jgi:cleavage stimulation factor subunit 3
LTRDIFESQKPLNFFDKTHLAMEEYQPVKVEPGAAVPTTNDATTDPQPTTATTTTKSATLTFLACVPDTGKLGRAKTNVTHDKWAVSSWQLILEWASQDVNGNVASKRALYRGVLELFPTSGRVWRDLAEMEMTRGKRELVEEYFSHSLLLCQHVPLWMVYLAFIKSNKQHTTPIAAREEAITAYEFALTHIGVDPESGPIWESYIAYLLAMPAANQFEESDRMSTIRRVYQRAIALPLESLESIWKSYQAWEMSVDPRLAQELTQKFATVYTDARVSFRERSGYTKSIRRTALAVPPNEIGDTLQQVLLWKRLILFEKLDTSAADAATHLKRVRFTFDSCLTVLRHYPEVWIDYATTVFEMLCENNASAGTRDVANDSAKKIWYAAVEAVPQSALLHFAYCSFLESLGALTEVAAVFNMMLERDEFSETDKKLALIQVKM